jgi:hypothetical protein
VLSLSPIDSLFHAPSWKLNIGMQTISHRECELCSNWNVNGGIGAAAETHLLRREVWFAFAEVEGNYSRAYEERHRVGGGASVGFMPIWPSGGGCWLDQLLAVCVRVRSPTMCAGRWGSGIRSRRIGRFAWSTVTAITTTMYCSPMQAFF